jgi:hypothetical protein
MDLVSMSVRVYNSNSLYLLTTAVEAQIPTLGVATAAPRSSSRVYISVRCSSWRKDRQWGNTGCNVTSQL